MKLRIKDIIKYPVFFVGALALMLAFLVLSAKVDRESVKENFEESAE